MFLAVSLFLMLTSLIAWVNERYLKLPTSVGVTLLSALGSVLVLVWHQYVSPLDQVILWTQSWEFDHVLIHGVLCFMLFAGAMHVDLHLLEKEKWMILILSTVGVFFSAFFSGVALWLVLILFGVHWDLSWCLLFGVIVSPTDAVVAADALKGVRLPDRLKAKILGESLFNDGTAIVLFSMLYFFIFGGDNPFIHAGQELISSPYLQWVVWLAYLIWQWLGAILVGVGFGCLFLYAIRTVNHPTVELLLTLACAMLSYACADLLFTSAPIAAVFAGLVVGYHGRKIAISRDTQIRLFGFWELFDELLNIGLFVLLGVQLLRVNPSFQSWVIGSLAVFVALLSRYFSLLIPFSMAQWFREFSPKSMSLMTWGGLKGGISLAMALSLPRFDGSGLMLTLTYSVIVFSIVFQGGFLLPRLCRNWTIADEICARRQSCSKK